MKFLGRTLDEKTMTPLLYGILILICGWVAIYLLFRGIKALDEKDKQK